MGKRKILAVVSSFLAFILVIIIFINEIKMDNLFQKNSTIDLIQAKKQPKKERHLEEKQISKDFFAQSDEETDRKVIYITFDDGPNQVTDKILAILSEYHIQATFFMLTRNVEKYPETVMKMVEAGHALACHGTSHQLKTFYQSNTSPLNEMKECANTIYQLTGQQVNIIRVPFGSFPHLTKNQKDILEKDNFILWDWNVDSKDWTNHSPYQLYSSVIEQVNKMEEENKIPVILFHDRENTLKALPMIIEKLIDLQYEFKRITEKDSPIQFKLKNE